VNRDALPPLVQAFERAKALSGDALCAEIREHRLTHEMIPTEAKADPAAWRAMLPSMPLEALVRNLGNMTKVGLLVPHGDATREVVRRLTDPAGVRQSMIHPFKILLAAVTYRAGKGFRGKGAWHVVGEIDSALDDAFALAFENVPATGKRFMLALDYSGSMWGSACAGSPQISAAAAASAMCTIIARSEKMPTVYGFGAANERLRNALTVASYQSNHGIAGLPGNWQKDTLASLQAGIQDRSFGPTDCALPMLHAAEQKLAVDCFVIFTDNESWAGQVHASDALQRYRASSGIQARLVVCAMSATSYSIADPSDAGMLDIVGLDASVPELIASFARGDV
jgi:60 kDa SS-A/Ro ribonucleoprotein